MGVEKVTQVTQTKPLREQLGYAGDLLYGQYTYGIAGERFFREIKDNGKLMGTRCNKCDLTYLPPRIYCERCFSELEDWVEVSSKGSVYTYTLAYVDLDGLRLDEPLILALVKFDGIYGGLVHRLGEVKPEEVGIGMPVEIVLKPKAERVGSILDIKYFKPCRK